MQIEVFHGSDLVVTNPELRISSRALDFGPDFYTTTNREQAMNFAKKKFANEIKQHLPSFPFSKSTWTN